MFHVGVVVVVVVVVLLLFNRGPNDITEGRKEDRVSAIVAVLFRRGVVLRQPSQG